MKKSASPSILTLFLLTFSVISAALSEEVPERNFKKTCGDCWCIPDDGVCPEFVEGVSDTLITVRSDAYKSFTLDTTNSEEPTLKSIDGGECYPFTDLDIDKGKIVAAANPQCEFTAMSELANAVCAYTYAVESVNDGESCEGRAYSMNTFESSAAAESTGAVVIHSGACGVCSNAKDVGNLISTALTLEDASKVCGSEWYLATVLSSNGNTLKKDYQELIECFETRVGFQNQCAQLWAHSTVASVETCKEQCVESKSIQQGAPLNGEAPECKLDACIACNDEKQRNQFDKLAGATNYRIGLTSGIARPCDEYYPVVHKPCGGVFDGITNAPTPTPVKNGSKKCSSIGGRVAYVVGAVMLAFAW